MFLVTVSRARNTDNADASLFGNKDEQSKEEVPMFHRQFSQRKSKSLLVRDKRILRPNNSIKKLSTEIKNREKENLTLKISKKSESDVTNLLSYYSDIASPMENIALLEAALSGHNQLPLHRKFGSLDSLNAEPATHRSLDSIMDSSRSKKALTEYTNIEVPLSYQEKTWAGTNDRNEEQIVSHLKDKRSHHRHLDRRNNRSTNLKQFKVAVVDGYAEGT